MREYGPKLGIFLLCILVFLAFPIYWFLNGEKYDYTFQEEEIHIELLEDGSLKVDENIVVQPHTMISAIEKDFFPISLNENKKYNCYDCLGSVTAYVDGVESSVEEIGTAREEKNIRRISFDPTTREFTVKLSYTINQKAVKRYTNLAVFGWNINPLHTEIN